MPELVVCIPGPWLDRSEFLKRIAELDPAGRYTLAGESLVDGHEQDHAELDLAPADADLPAAFRLASQGRISAATFDRVARHASIAYLTFPADPVGERESVLKFTELVRQAGGIAVKVESSGAAHDWEAWQSLLTGNDFDLYAAMVMLTADDRSFYSCGMHLYGLPECALPDSIDIEQAAELMNQFNFWRISERPPLESGCEFSMGPDTPPFRLVLEADARHLVNGPAHNEFGVWSFEEA